MPSEVVAAVHAAMRADLAVRKADLSLKRQIIQRVVISLIVAIAIGAGLLFGALHYWPPH